GPGVAAEIATEPGGDQVAVLLAGQVDGDPAVGGADQAAGAVGRGQARRVEIKVARAVQNPQRYRIDRPTLAAGQRGDLRAEDVQRRLDRAHTSTPSTSRQASAVARSMSAPEMAM